MGLCFLTLGCLVWGNPELEPTGCLVGLIASGRAHANKYFWELLLPPVSLSPQLATATPHLCRRPSNTSRYVWPSLLWGHYFFPLGPGGHETLCVPSKSRVSISPGPVEFLQSNPTAFQSQLLWELLLPLPDPQSGKPDMGLRTFTPVGEFLWYNCFPVCGLATRRVWDLILLQLCPSYHLVMASPLSLDVGYLVW